MSMKIIFLPEYASAIPNGKTRITRDKSMLFEPPISTDAFSIYPYHWSFELTTQKITDNKFLLRYAMGSLCFIQYTNAELVIPKSEQGKIYVVFSESPCGDGFYYSEYCKFQKKKYFDAKNKILAVGDVNVSHGKCVEFASGQFAVIGDSGKLVAIYVKID